MTTVSHEDQVESRAYLEVKKNKAKEVANDMQVYASDVISAFISKVDGLMEGRGSLDLSEARFYHMPFRDNIYAVVSVLGHDVEVYCDSREVEVRFEGVHESISGSRGEYLNGMSRIMDYIERRTYTDYRVANQPELGDYGFDRTRLLVQLNGSHYLQVTLRYYCVELTPLIDSVDTHVTFELSLYPSQVSSLVDALKEGEARVITGNGYTNLSIAPRHSTPEQMTTTLFFIGSMDDGTEASASDTKLTSVALKFSGVGTTRLLDVFERWLQYKRDMDVLAVDLDLYGFTAD